jgi:phosphate-selective porin OprO/OprP
LFGGRLQNDWGAYEPDDDVKDSFGGKGTGTKFRRARLYFQGQFFRYGFFKAEYEFSNNDDDTDGGTSFADVYAGINFPRIGLLRIGYFKEPFSLQFLNNSNFISFNERSGSDALSPGRNSGVMLNGNFLIRDSTYALAFMRRTDGVGDGFSNEGDYHITARVTGLPYFEDGGARLLHVELGYSHQFADKNVGTQYRQRPSNNFAPNIVDTGLLAAKNVELFNAGLAVIEGSLSLQSEVTVSIPHGGFSENPVFWGTYAELSWWVTGEHRRYLRGRGVFSRVVPKNRFDPEKDQWGAVELALRYSWLDLSNAGIRGGTLSEWSFALNWSPFSNMRVSNNYVLSQTRDRASIPFIAGDPGPPVVPDTPAISAKSGFAHSWVTRFEIDF